MVEWLESPVDTSDDGKRLDEIESYHTVADIVDSVTLTVTLGVMNHLPIFYFPNWVVNVIATDMVC